MYPVAASGRSSLEFCRSQEEHTITMKIIGLLENTHHKYRHACIQVQIIKSYIKNTCNNIKNIPTLVPNKIQTERIIKTLTKSEMNETMRGSSLNTLVRGDFISQRKKVELVDHTLDRNVSQSYICVVTARD